MHCVPLKALQWTSLASWLRWLYTENQHLSNGENWKGQEGKGALHPSHLGTWMRAKNLSLNPFISTQNELSLIIHTGYKHYSYSSPRQHKKFTAKSWFDFLYNYNAVLNTGHKSPTCYLHFTLWRCLCAWKSSQFQKKVSFTHDDAVEINQANQTSQWPHLCFWKGNMKCLHRCSHLQPDKLPSTLQSARCPEANLSSSNFWTLFLATSNMRNVQ